MPQKSLKRGFNDSDLELNPYVQEPLVMDTIQQSLARILGWSDDEIRWLRLRCDTDGRLLVSAAQSKVSLATISQLTMTGGTDAALADNPTRKAFTIQNKGAAIMKLSYVTPVGASNFFTIASNGIFSNDVYTGAVYLTGTAADIAELIEY